jgi:hypothetical protein
VTDLSEQILSVVCDLATPPAPAAMSPRGLPLAAVTRSRDRRDSVNRMALALALVTATTMACARWPERNSLCHTLLDSTVTLTFGTVPLDTALMRISEASRVPLDYDVQHVRSLRKRVDLIADRMTLGEALHLVLAGTDMYPRPLDDAIVISYSYHPTPAAGRSQ